MTDKEVEDRLREAAIRRAVPYLKHDIPVPTNLTYSDSGFEVLWDQGYVPASKLLILEGVSPAQVELQMRRVKALFGIVEPSDLISFPQELLAELVADFRAEIANEPTLSVQRLDERVIKEISEFRVEM